MSCTLCCAAGEGVAGSASVAADADQVMARALRKAVESGDTDLVYLVLFAAYAGVRNRSRSLSEFWSLVSARALARNLFVRYCKEKVGLGRRKSKLAGRDGRMVHFGAMPACPPPPVHDHV